MIKILIIISLMASVSSIAMWFAKNSGSIEIIWLGWEITTSLSFFILASFISIFTLLIIFFFVKKIVLLPIKIKQNLEQLRIKQSMTALEEGLLAAAYDEKEKVLLSYNKAKKYIKESPLYLLLELQNYIIKGNDAQCFSTYKKMLEFSASRPLAINGLISIANKNCDPELFSNMLNYASKYKVHLEFFIFEAIKFCIKNSDWNILKNYTNKSTEKLNNKVKNAISFLNFNLAKISLENNKTEEAKILLEEIFNSKIYFPSYVELYCNLNLQKNEKKLKKILKASWKHFPHKSILDFVLKSFIGLNMLEKVKLFINILEGHNNLYLKYLLLGEIKAKAKVWGDSRKDLLKSIELFPNKKAYLLLVHIEEQTSCNKNKIKNWLDQAQFCNDKQWQCKICSYEQEEWSIHCENCNNLLTFFNKVLQPEKKSKEDLIINNGNLKIA